MYDPVCFPDTRLSDSKWVKIVTGRGITSLTIPNLFKDDEGLYTIRMVTKGGTAEHGAFVSVSGNQNLHCGFIELNPFTCLNIYCLLII